MQTKDKSKLCAVYFFVKLLWNGVAAPDFGKWYFFARNFFGIRSGCVQKSIIFAALLKNLKKFEAMIYSIIGSGAIGAYYGAKLAKAGKNVHFLFHRDYDDVVAGGLQVDSCDGSFHLDNVNAYDSADKMPKSDVVLVCLKSVNNSLLADLLPPLLHGNTLVVLIENGIGVEADVQKMFPDVQLAAGLAFICSAKTEPARVNHQCYGYINIGNYSCRDAALVQRVVADFNEAGVKAAEVEYNEARWKKAVWNMPFNGLTVVMNTQTDRLLANPSTRSLVKDLMMEVVRAAQACGVKNIGEDFADKMIQNTLDMTPYSPSMKLDYDFGRPMEVYYLYTRPIEEARKAGYEMTKLQMLEQQLRFCDAR